MERSALDRGSKRARGQARGPRQKQWPTSGVRGGCGRQGISLQGGVVTNAGADHQSLSLRGLAFT